MIPYGRQSISDEDIQAVISVLRSDYLTQGPMVPLFEETVAAKVGARYSVATNSATSALHIACLALGLGEGDWLWTSPTSFVASANCALYCKANIDFVDIDPKTYNMSVDDLSNKLQEAKKNNKLPKIVIAVHLCGQSCEMESIYKLSQEYGFRIIEDASHAIGGEYKENNIGGCQYSDVTVFSFHPVKIVTTGEGGMALTRDLGIAQLLRRYSSHGVTSDKKEMKKEPDEEIWNYQQIMLGYNYRMTDIQAALGVSQLQRLDKFINDRRSIAATYDAQLSSLPVTIPWQHPDTSSSYHLYPLRIRKSDCGKDQRQVYEALRSVNILVNLHYIPIYRQPYYQAMGFERGYCPEAEKYYTETISIPIYPALTVAEQETVINQLHLILQS